MNKRTHEIINRFDNSWRETELFYRDLFENHEGFGFVQPFLGLARNIYVISL